MEAERSGRIFAVFLIAVTGRGVLGGTGTGGNITVFEVSPTIVPQDSSFTIKCTINGTGLEFPPIVHIKKSFGSRTWTLSENDNEDEETIGELAERASVVADMRGFVASVTLTIVSARREDTGNYTCSTSNVTNKRTTFVSVQIDPVNATMFIDGREVAGRVNVELGRTYAVSCLVTGGNPCPNMTLISGNLNLTDQISYTRQLQRESTTELLSPVTCRSFGNITWKADVAYIGKPLTCAAAGRPAVLASFEPHINHTEPLFYCNDTVSLRAYETELTINCSVYSQVADLTRTYVYWHTPTTNMSIEGNLQRDNEVPNTQDGHFRLQIKSPANSTANHWWYMILKVSSVRSLAGNLPQNSLYEFVAINKYATAKHTVQSALDVSPVGGAGTLKTFSSILVAMIAALGSSMLLVVRP